MKSTLWITAVVLVLSASLGSVAPQSGYDQFQKALAKERGDGNIEEAIALFQKVISETKDESLAAQAQLRIGFCYEKLGQEKARQALEAFQKVVEKYPAQTSSVRTAREKLLALAKTHAPGQDAARGLTITKLFDDGFMGSLSPDGTHHTLLTEEAELAVREVATGKVRRLTKNDKLLDHFANLSFFSPDGQKIAYSWYDDNEVFSLWLVNFDGSGNRSLVPSQKEWNVDPSGWFPDGKHILAVRHRSLYFPPALCQIVSVAVADGSFKVLKELRAQTPTTISLSPDGRFIVYDYPPADATNHDVYLMAADGSGSTRLVENPADEYALGWTPNGTRVLFSSDRAGNWGVWSVAVQNGKADGAATLVKPDLGRIRPIGFARDGALYYGIGGWFFDIYAQDVDLDQGKSLGDATLAVQRFVGGNLSLSWSPDGQYLTYISRRNPGARAASDVLRIRTVKTGAERELVPELNRFYSPRWSPDSRQLMVQGFDRSNRLGDFLLDVSTGSMRPVLQTGKDNYQEAITAEWSSDGKSVFYVRKNPADPKSQIMMRDLATVQDAPVTASPRKEWSFGAPKASPDGTRVAAVMFDETRKTTPLMVLPARGGEARSVCELEGSDRIGSFAWTPDSGQLLFIKKLPQDRRELWLVSVENGALRKVSDLPTRADRMALRPDGRKVAYTTSVRKAEVWVMENFLPGDAGTGKGKR